MDVLRRVAVAVVMRPALRAVPCADTHVTDIPVLKAACIAKLAGREEPVDMNDGSPELSANVFQKAIEFGEPVFVDFSAVSHLHPLHVEIFKAYDGILSA